MEKKNNYLVNKFVKKALYTTLKKFPFSDTEYFSRYPDVKINGISGKLHFLTAGFFEGRIPPKNFLDAAGKTLIGKLFLGLYAQK